MEPTTLISVDISFIEFYPKSYEKCTKHRQNLIFPLKKCMAFNASIITKTKIKYSIM
jgi:hypothetical protein